MSEVIVQSIKMKSSTLVAGWVGTLIFFYVASELNIKLIYGAVLIVPILWLLYRKYDDVFVPSVSRGKLIPILCFFGVTIISAAINASDLLMATFTRDFVVISGCYAMGLVSPKIQNQHIVWLFVCFIAGALLWGGNYKYIIEQVNEMNFMNFIMPNDAEGEFHMGAVYGLFLGYFWTRRSWSFFFVTFWFSLLSGKRVVIAGFFAALIISWIANLFGNFRFGRKIWLLLTLIAMASLAIYIDKIAEYFVDVFSLPMRPDRLIMGRNISSNFLRSEWMNADYIRFLFGHGPGTADFALRDRVSWGNGISALPHNDYLKLLYDVGVFGFFSYFWMFISFWNRNQLVFLGALYTLIAHTMDNTLIFPVHLLMLGMLSSCENFDPSTVKSLMNSKSFRGSHETI